MDLDAPRTPARAFAALDALGRDGEAQWHALEGAPTTIEAEAHPSGGPSVECTRPFDHMPPAHPLIASNQCGSAPSSATAMPTPPGRAGCCVAWKPTGCRRGWSAPTARRRNRPRLGTFFRDRDELPSSGDLGATIREALAESAALIVICSPAAAQSRWVNAEVEAFRASGRGDRVLCFVVDGEPGSADPAQQCFPPALAAPCHRWQRDRTARGRRTPRRRWPRPRVP